MSRDSCPEEWPQRAEAAEAELQQLRAERAEAVKMARAICRDNDWWSDWPDNLHLADVIEKRIYNLALDWKRRPEPPLPVQGADSG